MKDNRVEVYQQAVLAARTAAEILAAHPIEQLLRDIALAAAVAPILDPTLFRQKSRALAEDEELLRAAMPLKRWCETHVPYATCNEAETGPGGQR